MAELIATATVAADSVIDDCWNRIGVRGDRSCQKLKQHVHCHHCAVYAAAAKRILDMYPLYETIEADDSSAVRLRSEVTESILLFRLGDEWLGLPLSVLVEVAPVQVIHSLPHRRSDTVLGVSNVRGSLVACLSLARLLGLEGGAAPAGGRVIPRMLIIGTASEGNVVCPVDEINGVHEIPESLLKVRGDGKYSRAVFRWQERSICLLDSQTLLQAIKRSLA